MVLESLEKYVKLRGEQFDVIPPEKFLLKVIDNDNESDFYFNVEDYKTENGAKILIDRKPHTKTSTRNKKLWIDMKNLDSVFNFWVNLLKTYENVESFYDDPIVKSYANDYYAEFEIIEEDAEIKPLKPKQILLLDEYLENVENSIEKFETENNKSKIQEIKNDVIELRANLTSKPKAWVVRNLAKIWAKLTKQGTQFLKEFVSESKKQVIKEGVKFIIEQGTNLLN